MSYVKVNPTYTEIIVSDNFKKWEDSKTGKYQEYRKKWWENPKNQIIGNFPLHLDIESTRKCNLRCPMCPRTIKIERGEKIEEGDMNLELFKKLLMKEVRTGFIQLN